MPNDPHGCVVDLSVPLLEIWESTCRRRMADKTHKPLSDTQRQFYEARLEAVVAERQRRRIR